MILNKVNLLFYVSYMKEVILKFTDINALLDFTFMADPLAFEIDEEKSLISGKFNAACIELALNAFGAEVEERVSN